MQFRPGRESDFTHLETFVWQAIFPAFDQPGLSDEQRAENDALVELARTKVIEALEREHSGVFVAWDEHRRALAGYLIADRTPRAYAVIEQLIVKRTEWGKGIAAQLLALGTDFIGRDRSVQLGVRHYNERAIGFFEKHGFDNTGESAGEHAIPRILMLREAGEVEQPVGEGTGDLFSPPPAETTTNTFLETNPAAEALRPTAEDTTNGGIKFSFDFPGVDDEPVFEELPDYTLSAEDPEQVAPTVPGSHSLATEELPLVSRTLGEQEESSLTDDQLSDLEAFIARARAKKGLATEPTPEPVKQPVVQPEATAPPAFDRSKIEFEIDYGVREESGGGAEVSAGIEVVAEPTTKVCPNCGTELGMAVRFCSECGQAQFAEETAAAPTVEEVVHREPEPETAREPEPESIELPEDEPEVLELDDVPPVEEDRMQVLSLSALKSRFREYLYDRVHAYFGERGSTRFLKRYEVDNDFLQLRDGSLNALRGWLDAGVTEAVGEVRIGNAIADLTEYFIVEVCQDIHKGLFAQRLLRHQGKSADVVDLFKLVSDYLDLDSESEKVYTEFISMPPKVLQRITTNFLHARPDERIFLICDQSLLGNGKNGFAVTDSGLYWKSMLQPAGAVTYTTLREVRRNGDHLLLDGQFFDAGARLNLKVALLLDRLGRLS